MAVQLASRSAAPRTIEVQGWGKSFDDLAEHLWSMLGDMQRQSFFGSNVRNAWSPPVNLYETPVRFLVCMELAGMERDKIDVRAADGELCVRGVRCKPVLPDGQQPVSVHLMEIDSGRFERRVPIPEEVLLDEISATYRSGYLWVVMPRRKAADRGGPTEAETFSRQS